MLTAAAVAVALTGCSGGSTPSGGGKAVTGNAIAIKDFAYAPAALTAKVGETITVTNEDAAVHTITASDKSFDSGDLAKGKAFTFQIKKAGTYDYICDIHQYMKGTITVS